MAIDTDEQFSAGWWLKVLGTQLQERRNGRRGRERYRTNGMYPATVRPGIDLLDNYFNGDPPLAQVATEYEDFVRSFIRAGRLNIADTLVSSTTHRMQLRDFRTSAANDEAGDVQVRKLMRDNGMKPKINDVHDWMLAHADSYGIITPPDDFRDYSLFTPESAQQVITAHDAATNTMLAGLKLFRDDWDLNDFAYVFFYDTYADGMPTGRPQLWVASKRGRVSSISDQAFRVVSTSWDWERRTDLKGKPGDPLPIVRFHNRKGIGEFEQHLSTLDRINDKIANEWWLIKMQAFRQRVVKGLPVEDEQGNKITAEDWAKILVADPGALWNVPEDVDFWESTPTDITPVTNAIKEDLEKLAAVTHTALHTLLPDTENQSAVGAAAKKEEQAFKVEDRRDRAHTAWTLAMSLMLGYSNDPELQQRAALDQLEPIWGPVERYSLSEKADATAKIGDKLPTEAIWTDVLQYPPAEIPNLRTMMGRQLIFQQATQPAPQPAAPGRLPQPSSRPAPSSPGPSSNGGRTQPAPRPAPART